MGGTDKYDIKNNSIAIFYKSLEFMGGIERVIIELLNIFNRNGINCYIFTETEIKALSNKIDKNKSFLISTIPEKRDKEWQRYIEELNIKFLIIHHAFHPSAKADIATFHRNNAFVILNIHFSFPSPILFNEAFESYRKNKEIGELCDAVATVSEIDSYWWRSLGCNAFHVQNPFVPQDTNNKIEKEPYTIIWVGRHVEPKQPLEALKAMHHIAKEIPEAKLLMVGGGGQTKQLAKIVKKLDIEENVEFYAERPDIADLYSRASLLLLTSITESFCLVLAEAKVYGIPAVMYEIPFLELVQGENCGCVQVERMNNKALADATIDLLKNREKIERLSDEAVDFIKKFNPDNVLLSWMNIFKAIETQNNSIKIHENKNYDIIIKEIYWAWNYHADKNSWKWDFFDNFERYTKHSLKNFTHNIIKIAKRIKQI